MIHSDHTTKEMSLAGAAEVRGDSGSAVATLLSPANDSGGEFPFPPYVACGKPSTRVSPAGYYSCTECNQRLVATYLAGILDQLLSVLVRYVRFPSDEAATATVLWVAHVLEAGGDEEEAIAGLLHDSLEDIEYTQATYEELADLFGERVAGIVRDCSDAEPAPGVEKEPWRQRKETYIARPLRHSPDSILVSNADKLHNARAILADYRLDGEELWKRFNPDTDQLWYYRSLADTYDQLGSPLADELHRVVTELEGLVKNRT